MAQSQSESSAIIANQIKIKDFCDDKKIPYLFVYVDVTKKKKGLPTGAFASWQKKTYDELISFCRYLLEERRARTRDPDRPSCLCVPQDAEAHNLFLFIEVVRSSALVTNGQNSSHQPSTLV